MICAQIEQEIAELDDEEKAMFLEELGLKESGLEKLVKASYSLLGLISYLTSGEDETRAWTIRQGTKAPQAAGKIHSDFERGFIRAEVVNYQDLLDCGSLSAAKEKGLVGLSQMQSSLRFPSLPEWNQYLSCPNIEMPASPRQMKSQKRSQTAKIETGLPKKPVVLRLQKFRRRTLCRFAERIS